MCARLFRARRTPLAGAGDVERAASGGDPTALLLERHDTGRRRRARDVLAEGRRERGPRHDARMPRAIEALYGAAFAITFGPKDPGVRRALVMPLEGRNWAREGGGSPSVAPTTGAGRSGCASRTACTVETSSARCGASARRGALRASHGFASNARRRGGLRRCATWDRTRARWRRSRRSTPSPGVAATRSRAATTRATGATLAARPPRDRGRSSASRSLAATAPGVAAGRARAGDGHTHLSESARPLARSRRRAPLLHGSVRVARPPGGRSDRRAEGRSLPLRGRDGDAA